MSDDPELGDVCPKRFGLNYDPPSIVLEYLQLSTGKLFHRRIGLRRLRKSSDPGRVAEKLRQRNKVLLEEDKVSLDQIVTLVKKLQESLKDEVKERKSQSSAKSNNNSLSAPVSVIQPVASPAKDEARKLDFDKAALSPSENQEDIPVAQDMNLNVLSTDDLTNTRQKWTSPSSRIKRSQGTQTSSTMYRLIFLSPNCPVVGTPMRVRRCQMVNSEFAKAHLG